MTKTVQECNPLLTFLNFFEHPFAVWSVVTLGGIRRTQVQ